MNSHRPNVRCGGVFDISTPEGRAYAVRKLGEAEVAAIEALVRAEARHLRIMRCRECAMQQAKAAVARRKQR